MHRSIMNESISAILPIHENHQKQPIGLAYHSSHIHISFSSFLFIPFSSIVWCAQFIPLCDVGQGCYITWLTMGGDTFTLSNTHFAKNGLHSIPNKSGKRPYFSTSRHVFFLSINLYPSSEPTRYIELVW